MSNDISPIDAAVAISTGDSMICELPEAGTAPTPDYVEPRNIADRPRNLRYAGQHHLS